MIAGHGRDPGFFAGLGEIGVFGEKAVTRMNAFGCGLLAAAISRSTER